jgi:hypothetical protein
VGKLNRRRKEMKRFYSYSNENGITYHDSLEEAKTAADDDLDGYRDLAASYGWEESEAESICYGVVIGQSVKTYEKKKENMTEQEIIDLNFNVDDFDSFVEYDVKEF